MLLKLLRYKVLASITNYNVKRVLIYINPTDLQCILSDLYTYILEKLSCLKRGCFINNIEDWFTIKIHDINNNISVELIVIFKGKLESVRSLDIYLALIAVFHQIFNSSLFNFIACSLQDSNKILYRQMTELAMQLVQFCLYKITLNKYFFRAV